MERLKSHRERTCANLNLKLDKSGYILSRESDRSKPPMPDRVTQGFIDVARRHGLEHIRSHSLRHFAATVLITQGIEPRTSESRLGHFDPSMTLKVYSHQTVEADHNTPMLGGGVC